MPTLHLSDLQISVLEKALDLYSRTLMGQLAIVSETLGEAFPEELSKRGLTHWDLKTQYLAPLAHDALGLEKGSYYGIYDPKVSENGKIAHDLQKTLQKYLAASKQIPAGHFWHDGNILPASKEPPATITET
jgi:hypothetical protein